MIRLSKNRIKVKIQFYLLSTNYNKSKKRFIQFVLMTIKVLLMRC